MGDPGNAGGSNLHISIGEAARIVRVSPSTLRAWESRGWVTPERSPAGYRRYTLADISALKRVLEARGTSEREVAHGRSVPAAPSGSTAVAVDEGRGAASPSAPWGQRLREQRQTRGLTLRQVSRNTGLSASFISSIERGLANPSVAALQKLTQAYGVSIVNLVGADVVPGGRLVRVADRQRYAAADGVVMDQLNFGDHLMELHLFTVEPGAGTGGAFQHEGEEFILMLSGTLHVAIDVIEQYVLCRGDVLYFESSHRHEWTNPGPGPAVFLGVNTPRTF